MTKHDRYTQLNIFAIQILVHHYLTLFDIFVWFLTILIMHKYFAT